MLQPGVPRRYITQQLLMMITRRYGNPWPLLHASSGADEASNALQDARLKLEAAEATLQALQREKRDIELFGAGSTDFGPDDIYLPLAGK